MTTEDTTAGAPIFDPWTSQELITASDDQTGLRAVIAMDDLTLGPGFGGVRFRSYDSPAAAVREAQRLAAAMTYKHALAELPYGGAKSVILDDGRPRDAAQRRALFEAFGRVVASTGGRYIPGVDMGTTLGDMDTVRGCGARVYCADHDPSPWTARGVYAAMRAAARHALGAQEMRGVRVAVQGAGHVGAALARYVAADGGHVLVADVDPARAADVVASLEALPGSAEVTAPDAVVTAACDVFAPSAVARVIRAETVERLRCTVVAGAANDTLDAPEVDGVLAAAGITFVPDFVANAGGVIHEHGRALGWDEERIGAAVDAIDPRVEHLYALAADGGSTLTEAALTVGRERLAAARPA